jgi:hypothetical protein
VPLHHHITGVDVALRQQLHAVDAAAGDHQFTRAWRRAFPELKPSGYVVARPGEALGRRVLQGDGRVLGDQLGRDAGQDVGRKSFRVGESAAERDDVGRPGQGEDGGDLPAAQCLRPAGQPGAPVVLLKGCGHLPARSRQILS